MNLKHLCSTPHVSAYFDSWNNWLFVDWEGELTLPNVQNACLTLAHCFLSHSYPRVLNCNSQVMSVEWEAAGWLAEHFFPHLGLAGVKQVAWVHAPTLQGRNMAEDTIQRLPSNLDIALFGDVEQAVTWLQHTRPGPASGCALMRLPTTEAKLTKVVQAFGEHLAQEITVRG